MSDDKVHDAQLAIARIEERINQWMNSTTEYRLNLCSKIDSITRRLDALPCRERGEMYKGLSVTMKLVWASIGITFGILVTHLGWK